MKSKGILGGIIVVVLVLVLALAVGGGSVSAEEPTIIASGSCGKDGSNVTWALDSTGLLTISGEGEMESYSSVNKNGWITTAPWQNRASTLIIQEGVASIGSFAFCGCTGLTSVTIPDSVTSIFQPSSRLPQRQGSLYCPDSSSRVSGSPFPPYR